MTTAATTTARYSWGGDEHIFVELAESMSLPASIRAMAITTSLRENRPDGILEICPANASYQVRFDPDVIDPRALLGHLQDLEREVGDAGDFSLSTRIVEIPVLYQDPWTTETLMRFRDRHQDPDATDIEYAARINGLSGPEEFIRVHSGSPWFTSMVGFVTGLPFMFQMVPQQRQLVVPKYLRPRTDTPKQTVGHGGCFGCVYSVRGAGGYQMFGITPAPIYDPDQSMPDFDDFMVYFRPGDIVKFTPIDRDRYDDTVAEVEAGDFRLRSRRVDFSPQAYLDDPDGFNARLLEVLRAD
ncbi:carboxyltransferase domain-containing protein [Saccharopolyspora sp. WRP15-2]|uniref:Carboxyltransferase domain-containing protein n=1 Tax=Saccharopolyspora oryzae TaxID=2997343 RepID=A0ABT4USJ2_9PSEU|nr:carboxyltransferase domain-containing protein [Saccharopolyspora oryzae]MDA3624657.1 carboxyltransferase domain-containing protein [Saccharopolyspora oryzae]